MLISFVGAPASGKTTLALGLGFELKKMGEAVEYLPEKARDYIRMNKLLGKIDLEIYDQDAIFQAQKNQESLHVKFNGPNTFTITDGSSVNSLYYLKKDSKVNIKEEIERYDLVVVCENVEVECKDENRVHDKEFSKKMRLNFIEAIKCYDVLFVKGDVDERLKTLVNHLKSKGLIGK